MMRWQMKLRAFAKHMRMANWHLSTPGRSTMSFQLNTPWYRLEGLNLLTEVRDLLVRALLEEKKKGRCSQAKIAEVLGVHRSVVHNQLVGAADIHVTRVGEIAAILGRDVEIRITGNPADEVGRNLRPLESQGGSAPRNPMKFPSYGERISTDNTLGSRVVEGAL